MGTSHFTDGFGDKIACLLIAQPLDLLKIVFSQCFPLLCSQRSWKRKHPLSAPVLDGNNQCYFQSPSSVYEKTEG